MARVTAKGQVPLRGALRPVRLTRWSFAFRTIRLVRIVGQDSVSQGRGDILPPIREKSITSISEGLPKPLSERDLGQPSEETLSVVPEAEVVEHLLLIALQLVEVVRLFLCSILSQLGIVVIEPVGDVLRWVHELLEIAPLLLRRATGAARPPLAISGLHGLEDLVLAPWGDVLEILGHQLGSHASLGEPHHLEGEGHRRLLHLDAIPHPHLGGGLEGDAIAGDTIDLARLGGYGAGLEDSGAPEPAVYT